MLCKFGIQFSVLAPELLDDSRHRQILAGKIVHCLVYHDSRPSESVVLCIVNSQLPGVITFFLKLVGLLFLPVEVSCSEGLDNLLESQSQYLAGYLPWHLLHHSV